MWLSTEYYGYVNILTEGATSKWKICGKGSTGFAWHTKEFITSSQSTLGPCIGIVTHNG